MGWMRPWALAVSLFIGLPLLAQGPENVLLVVNRESNDSKAVAQYYRERRGIPAENVCTIRTLDEEVIARVHFEDEIRKPVLGCLAKRHLQDRVLYIVLTRGVPLKIKAEENESDRASVDSELTLAYQDLLGVSRRYAGPAPNPYCAPHAAGRFVRFSHRDFPIYLVTRLDGYNVADVRALIDRGIAAGQPETAARARDGRFVLDLNYDDNAQGNKWLREAAAKLREAGISESRVRLETSQVFLAGEKDVLGYASWGSNDRANFSRFLRNTWVNGALAMEFVSTDARTFTRPPEKWNIGKWSDPPGSFFAGSPQSLLGDYIQEGVTGVAGNVYEPYLSACARPQILFPAYVRGHNLAESFYAALPFLSWQTVVIGDPLVAPFPGPSIPPEELNPPNDPATGLPKFFAQHLARTKAQAQRVTSKK
jgi:uncharacterized protein (TIGR03790 family)